MIPKAFFANIEAVEDVAEVLAANHAIAAMDITPNIYDGETITKAIDRGFEGAREDINVNPHNGVSFSMYMQTSGLLKTPPPQGVILRCMRLGEVIDETVDDEKVIYSFIPDQGDCITGAYRERIHGGSWITHMFTGGRGKFGLELVRGQFPKILCNDFKGTYIEEIEEAIVTEDMSAFIDPLPLTKDNTPIVQIDGYDVCFEKITLDSGFGVTRIDAPNCRRTTLNDLNVTGTITVKATTLAQKNFFEKMRSHKGTISKVPIVARHGKIKNYINDLILPNCKLGRVKHIELNKSNGYEIPYKAIPINGYDEMQYICR